MPLKTFVKSVMPKNILRYFRDQRSLASKVSDIVDLSIFYQTTQLQHKHQNPLNRFGKKCFSQTDEDGLTVEILRRLQSLEGGSFAEFGVGNGTENNTLILKALGWKGFWVGGEELSIRLDARQNDFTYIKSWVTRENIMSLTKAGMNRIQCCALDVISLDLDGNDIYFVDDLLSGGFLPKLFIVEYNAKFIPPVRWKVQYDPNHTWQGDDYFGASLASFVDLFEFHNYRLICCNSHTGANAFFVRSEFHDLFPDVPTDIYSLYVAPRYYLYNKFGHPQSIRTVEGLFA